MAKTPPPTVRGWLAGGFGYQPDYLLPDIDDEAAMARLTDRYGANASKIAGAFQEAYPDHALADTLASFAADGNPSTATLAWRPYTNESHDTMVLDLDSACKTDYDAELVSLVIQGKVE